MKPGGVERPRMTGVESALADLERALCRDRCHAVVCAPPGPAREALLRELAPRLSGALRVLRLPDLADADALCAALLSELGEAPGIDAEASLIGVAKRLAGQGSALALVAPDARALPVASLRRLGRLAVLSRPGLRLVLCVATEAAAARDTLSEIMVPLGVGAVKVVLDAPPERAAAAALAAPAPAPLARSAAPAPPAPETTPRQAPRRRDPVLTANRAARRARELLAGRAGWSALAALGLALGAAALHRPDAEPARTAAAPLERAAPAAVLASLPQPALDPDPEPEPQPEPAPPAPPRAPAAAPVAVARLARPPAPAPAAAPVADVAPLATLLALPPVAPPEPAAAELAAPAPPEPEAPSEPPIRVSVNADPWARVQVNGRDVGVTPMSDLELPPGSHRFRVRFPDGRVIERSVRVDALRDHVHFP